MRKHGSICLVIILSLVISLVCQGQSAYGAEISDSAIVESEAEFIPDEEEQVNISDEVVEEEATEDSELVTSDDQDVIPCEEDINLDADDMNSNDEEEAVEEEEIEPDGELMPTGYVAPSERVILPAYSHDEDGLAANRGELEERYMSTLSELKAKYPTSRNQGQYGTCVIFAVLANAELSMISSGEADRTVDYSEFQLAEFTDMGPDYYGTNYEEVLPYMSQYVGLIDEKKAPYSKIGKETLQDNLRQSEDVAVLDYYKTLNIKTNPELVKEEIKKNGAVVCSYFTPGATVSNGTNISCKYYNRANNSFNFPDDRYYPNHAVAIVGWDDNFSKNKFDAKPSHDGAWLIRNSWSSTTEMSLLSYFWMSYESKSMDSTVYSVYMRPADEVDRQTSVLSTEWKGGYNTNAGDKYYYYDIISESSSNYIKLNEVGITTYSYTNHVVIDLYKNLKSKYNLSSGEKVAEKIVDTDIPFWGFTTLKLSEDDEDVIIENNGKDTYTLVMHYTEDNPNANYYNTLNLTYVYTQEYVTDTTRYNIFFDGNSASNPTAMDELNFVEYENGVEYELPENLYQRKGYTFVGWNTKPDGTGRSYRNKQKGIDFTVPGNHLKLYAIWRANEYRIHFDANNGEGQMDDFASYYGAQGKLPQNTFTREGYVFIGWKIDGTGETISDEADTSSLFTGGEYLLKAYWVAVSELFEIDENNILQKYHPISTYHNVVIPDGVVGIGEGAFSSVYSMYTVSIPDSVTEIGNRAFLYCTALYSITGAKNVRIIGDEAFKAVNGLYNGPERGFVFPDSVEKIGKNVLGSTSYEYVYFGDNILAIDGLLKTDGTYGNVIKICCRPNTYGVTYATQNGYSQYGRYELRIHKGESITDEYYSWIINGYKFVVPDGLTDKYGEILKELVYKDASKCSSHFKRYNSYYVYGVDPKIAIENLADENGIVDLVQYVNKDALVYFYFKYGADYSNVFLYGRTTYGKPYGKAIEEEIAAGNELGAKKGVIIKGFVIENTNEFITEESICHKNSAHNLTAVWGRAKTLSPQASYENGSVFETETDVYLYCKDVDARIYYTVNGEEPTAESTLYSGSPIKVNKSLCLKAMAVNDLLEPSEVMSYEYSIHDIHDIKIEDSDEEVDSDELEKLAEKGLWVRWVDGQEYDYTGSQIKPRINVFYGKNLLTLNKDYTLKYASNVNAGTGKIYITGKGNYKDSTKNKPYEFTIRPINLATAGLLQTALVVVKENGKVQKAANTVLCQVNGKQVTLKANRDFKYIYPGTVKNQMDYDENAFKSIGEYVVTVEGIKNYCGNLSYVERIQMEAVTSIAKIKCGLQLKYEYVGEAINPVNENIFVDKKGESLKLRGINRSDYDSKVLGGIDKVKDYDYIYEIIGDNIEIGSFTVKFVGINAYNGAFSKKVTITGKSLKGFSVSGIEKAGYEYSGSEIKPELVVSKTTGKGESKVVETLILNKDYRVEYPANVIKSGKVSFTVRGINNYSGTLKGSYVIKPYSVKSASEERSTGKLSITYEEKVNYIKSGAKPEVKVYFDGQPLSAGTDYTVSYSNNKAVAVAEAVNKKGQRIGPKLVVTGKGSFSGSQIVRYFTIEKAGVENLKINVNDISASGLIKVMAAFTVTDSKNSKLVANKDYTYRYSYVHETRRHLSKKDDGYIAGAGQIVESKDLVSPLENTYAGNNCVLINIVITGKGAYTGARLTQYVIGLSTQNIAKAKVAVKAVDYKKYGANLKPEEITVVIGDKTLVYGKDYILMNPVNNMAKGTATVTIIGQGDYYGNKIIKYKINPQSIIN